MLGEVSAHRPVVMWQEVGSPPDFKAVFKDYQIGKDFAAKVKENKFK